MADRSHDRLDVATIGPFGSQRTDDDDDDGAIDRRDHVAS
jgi:hypothetical protein